MMCSWLVRFGTSSSNIFFGFFSHKYLQLFVRESSARIYFSPPVSRSHGRYRPRACRTRSHGNDVHGSQQQSSARSLALSSLLLVDGDLSISTLLIRPRFVPLATSTFNSQHRCSVVFPCTGKWESSLRPAVWQFCRSMEPNVLVLFCAAAGEAFVARHGRKTTTAPYRESGRLASV